MSLFIFRISLAILCVSASTGDNQTTSLHPTEQEDEYLSDLDLGEKSDVAGGQYDGCGNTSCIQEDYPYQSKVDVSKLRGVKSSKPHFPRTEHMSLFVPFLKLYVGGEMPASVSSSHDLDYDSSYFDEDYDPIMAEDDYDDLEDYDDLDDYDAVPEDYDSVSEDYDAVPEDYDAVPEDYGEDVYGAIHKKMHAIGKKAESFDSDVAWLNKQAFTSLKMENNIATDPFMPEFMRKILRNAVVHNSNSMTRQAKRQNANSKHSGAKKLLPIKKQYWNQIINMFNNIGPDVRKTAPSKGVMRRGEKTHRAKINDRKSSSPLNHRNVLKFPHVNFNPGDRHHGYQSAENHRHNQEPHYEGIQAPHHDNPYPTKYSPHYGRSPSNYITTNRQDRYQRNLDPYYHHNPYPRYAAMPHIGY